MLVTDFLTSFTILLFRPKLQSIFFDCTSQASNFQPLFSFKTPRNHTSTHNKLKYNSSWIDDVYITCLMANTPVTK